MQFYLRSGQGIAAKVPRMFPAALRRCTWGRDLIAYGGINREDDSYFPCVGIV